MRIQLRPEHLGGLYVKVVQNGGEVEISFLTSNPEVKRLLEGNLPSLLEALRDVDVKVSKIGISLVDIEPQFFHGRRDELREEEEEEVLIHDSRLPWLAGVVDYVA
jgi:flagellar hook-length control protein FliK